MENYFSLLKIIIKKYISMKGAKKLCILFEMSLSVQQCQEILKIEHVSAILLWENAKAHLNLNRVGTLNFDGTWTLPVGKYDMLLIMESCSHEVMGIKRSIRAIKNKIYLYADYNEFFTQSSESFLRYFFRFLFERVKETFNPTLKLKDIGKIPDFHAIKDKIIVINSSLAAGGAERQTVNTLLGFHDKGVKSELWCTHWHDDEHKFYLPHLEGKVSVSSISFRKLQLLYEIFVNQSQILLELSELRDSERFQYLKKVCPSYLFQDIHDFANLYVEAKPEIVYLWQDYNNIIAGLAA